MVDQHHRVGPRCGWPQVAMAGRLLRHERRERDAGERHLAAEAAAAPGDQQRRLKSLAGDQVERTCRRQGEERLAAIVAGHRPQAMIGAHQLDHPPAQRRELHG